MGCASSAEKVVVLDDLAAVRTASGRAPCGKFLSADDYNRASACWTLRHDFSLDTFAGHLERVVRLQSIFRGYAIRKRVRIDQNVFKLLRQAEASWAGPHAAVRPPVCRPGDLKRVIGLRHRHANGEALPGIFNPYAKASAGPWARASFHVHTSDGEILRADKPTEQILRDCAGYNLVGLVANAHNAVVDADLEQRGATLGMHVLAGAELLFESGLGPHFGFFPQHPELAMAYHPTMGTPIDLPKAESCPKERLFAAELTGVHFHEVANGYVRLAAPEPVGGYSWRSDGEWDALLSSGCLVWGMGSGDSYQGIRSGNLGHDNLGEYVQTGVGLAYNVLCVAPDASLDTMLHAVRSGCFYFSTGPTIDRIEVEGTRITVAAAGAHKIVATTDDGAFLTQEYGASLSFDPWDLLARRDAGTRDATYVRVTVSEAVYEPPTQAGAVQRSRIEFAWTQPFWLSLDGFSLARDRRRHLLDAAAPGHAASLRKNYRERFDETFRARFAMVDCA